jgi:hypothetical protein
MVMLHRAQYQSPQGPPELLWRVGIDVVTLFLCSFVRRLEVLGLASPSNNGLSTKSEIHKNRITIRIADMMTNSMLRDSLCGYRRWLSGK